MAAFRAARCLLGLLLVAACCYLNAAASDKPENGQPTVNECRVHVEAALKKYWEHDPEQTSAAATSPTDSLPDSTAVDDKDGDDDQEPSSTGDLTEEVKEKGNEDEGSDDEQDEEDDENKLETEESDQDSEKSEEEEEAAQGSDTEEEDEKKGSDTEEEEEKKGSDDEHSDDDEDENEDKINKDDDRSEDQSEGETGVEETETEIGDADEDESSDDEVPPEEGANNENSTDLGVEQELLEQESEADQPEAEIKDKVPEVEQEEVKVAEVESPSKVQEEANEVMEGGITLPEESTSDGEEDEDEGLDSRVMVIRNRQHIDDILGLDDIGTEVDKDESFLVQSTLKELKKSYDTAIKPLEGLYNFKEMSDRVVGDAEIFGKPTVLLLGPWSSGKSSIINYLLGVERTPSSLKTAPEPTDTKFTVVTYGEKTEVVSGTEMAADWPYSTVQKFGQGFLNHFRGVRMPHRLLQKITLIDTPGILESRKQQDKGYPFNEAFQWFIDRADAIYIVFDPAKLEIGNELEAILDQLKGREAQVRFILNKADTIRRTDLMRITGQLFWNLSPLLGSTEAPVIYTVSLMTKPFHPGSPARFLLEQEKSFLHDIRVTIDRRVENRVAYVRRHAVRVRNHAKMVDCYLATYYRHKSLFSNRKKVAESITENPDQYSIYAGLSALTNVSRYDLPDPNVYKVFFRLHALYDFKPLTATCSYFKGCPLDKMDIAIAYDLPELLGKYKKRTKIQPSDLDQEKGR